MPMSVTPPPRTAPRDGAAARAVAAAFGPVESPAAALAAVRRLALGHYENFSVVSALVPRAIRQDYCNLYAFCRTADDLGDETGDPTASLGYLADLRHGVAECYAGRPTGAVFTALATTVRKFDIPQAPFLDLISAFEQDQTVPRYDTFDQLSDYCRRSADPVGRLVLYVCGFRDEGRQRLSDYTCSALQLTNFWQDVRRDYDGPGRVYLPAEWMDRFGVSEDDLRGGRATVQFKEMMRHAVDRTTAMFAQGEALLPTLPKPVAAHVGLFAAGGRAILDAIRRQDYDTLTRRPTLGKWGKSKLVGRAAVARLSTLLTPAGPRPAGGHA